MARIKLRRDTAANWTAVNPVLDDGEPGYETDTEKLKIGNGSSDWITLPYFGGGFDGGVITGPLEITANATSNNGSLILSGNPYASAGAVGLLEVGSGLNFTDKNILASFVGNVNDYTQVVVSNKNSGTSASSDIILNNNTTSGTTIYGDLGINSTTYVGGGGPFDQPNMTYLHAAGGELALGTIDPYNVTIATNSVSRLEFYNNGTVEFQPSAKVEILNTTDSTAYGTGALVVQGGLGVGKTIVANDNLYLGVGATSVPLTDPVIVVKQNGAGFIQSALINSNDNGSADFVAYTQSSTENEGFADMGFTGATFNDPAYTITDPGDGYIFVQGMNNPSSAGRLVLATGSYGTEKDIIFGTGGFLAGNEKMRLIHSLGTLSISTNTASTNTTSGALKVTGGVGISGDVNIGGTINKITLTAPASGSTLTIADGRTITFNRSTTFPNNDGSSNSALLTDGAGNLSWSSIPGIPLTYSVVGVDYTASSSDEFILVDNNLVSICTISLPATAANGKTYTIKKTTSGGLTVRVNTVGGITTIDGSASNIDITAAYGYLTVVYSTTQAGYWITSSKIT